MVWIFKPDNSFEKCTALFEKLKDKWTHIGGAEADEELIEICTQHKIEGKVREVKFKTSLRVGFFLDFRNFIFASFAAVLNFVENNRD